MISSRYYSENSLRNGGYVSFFSGGEGLFESGRLAYSSEILGTGKILTREFERFISQGDWRGVGRDDWIGVSRFADAFYFRNDPPFQLEKFANAIFYDTIWASWESNESWYLPHIPDLTHNGFSMRVFPKPEWDKSVDFLPRLPTGDTLDYGIWMFKGGPDFGSKRLNINKPDFHIRHPGQFDGGFAATSTGNLRNCGDMSGKGYDILQASGYSQSGSYHLFYATGKALDEQADMFIRSYGIQDGGTVDTITANDDGLQDVIIGRPGFLSQADFERGYHDVGLIEIVYGSSKIPTKINPLLAVSTVRVSTERLSMYPNPVSQSTTIALPTSAPSHMMLSVVNVLGETVHTESIEVSAPLGQFTWQRPITIRAGVYYLQLRGEEFNGRVSCLLR
jgi:hypothetical protein